MKNKNPGDFFDTHIGLLKKPQNCKRCSKDIPVGTKVALRKCYGKYNDKLNRQVMYFEAQHIKCHLELLEQRLKENITADAPEIILKEFRDLISLLRKELEVKDETNQS